MKLGDAQLFDALQELTKPKFRAEKITEARLGRGASPGVGAPRVMVLERQALGPFDVTTLAASDAAALSHLANDQWLPPA